jgi:hypothetical protein
MMRRFGSVVRGLAVAAFMAIGPGSQAGEGGDAAGLLFEQPYLSKVAPGSSIVYDYELISTDDLRFGQGFKDTIRLRVEASEGNADKRTANLDIFSGPRGRKIGPLPNTTGNPAVMIVLEQDTFDLQRALGGMPAYFRNAIRRALRDKAEVQSVKVAFEGAEIDAKRITIKPFDGDQNFSRVPDYSRTVYEFVVADAVPGGLYSVTSFIPDVGDPKAALKKKTLAFSAIKKM